MTAETSIKLFEDRKVRIHWAAIRGKWFFSVIDVIQILAESPRPRKYWSALKTKLAIEGSQLSHSLGQLKMQPLVKKEEKLQKMPEEN
jgi:hypothetical protein